MRICGLRGETCFVESPIGVFMISRNELPPLVEAICRALCSVSAPFTCGTSID